MQFIKKILIQLKNLFLKPSMTIGLGILVTGGFLAGLLFWQAFNTGMEYTNSEQFCVSCHTMSHNQEELQETVHWKNRTGVRAYCADCHVPHNFTDKIARKMQASREVLSHIMGDIDTKEKFEEKRLVLAQREWKRLTANGSKECRACHDYNQMDFDKMSIMAQMQMKNAAQLNTPCIECHKGIAHKLPEIKQQKSPELTKLIASAKNEKIGVDQTGYNVLAQPIYADSAMKERIGTLEVATAVKVLETTKDADKVELSLWRKSKGFSRVWYEKFGLNVVSAVFEKEFAQNKDNFTVMDTKEDPLTGLGWEHVKTDVWVKKGDLTSSSDGLWDVAKASFNTSCSVCHRPPEVDHFDTNTWPGIFSGMVGFTNMDNDTQKLVLKYLQFHSSDFDSDKRH